MKKTKSIICFALLVAVGSATLTGFLSQPAKGVNAAQEETNETKTVYLDAYKLLEDESGYGKRWDDDNAVLDIWSWEKVTTTRDKTGSTIYFTNSHNWKNVLVHFWGGSQPSAWPGVEMNKVENTSNVYSYDVGDNTHVVFHNGSGTQTLNMEIPSGTGGTTGTPNSTWETSYDKNGKNSLFYPVSGVDNLYFAEIPAENNKADFVRASSSWTFNETTYPDYWNRVTDQTLAGTKNCLDITDWNEGAMRKYTPDVSDGYYVLGEMNNWTPANEQRMSFLTGTYYISISFKMYEAFKVGNVFRGGVSTWFGYDELSGTAKSTNQLIKASGESTNIVCVNPGTYTPKVTPGLSSTLFACDSIAPVAVPEIRIGNDKYFMTPNPSNPNEYMTNDPVAVESGDTVAYFLNGVLQTATPKKVGNNNCWNNNGVTTVVLNAYGKIYVDITDPNALTIFCDANLPTQGTDKNVYGISLNNSYVALRDNGTATSYDEWYTQGLLLEKGDKIKFVNTKLNLNNAEVFTVIDFDSATLPEVQSCFDTSAGLLEYTGESKLLDIYVKMASSGNKVYIAFSNEDVNSAVQYAENFSVEFIKICDDKGIDTDKDALQKEWVGQSSLFNDLSKDAKAFLTNAKATDSNVSIKMFVHYYDFILGKYGSQLFLENFAGRDVSSKSQVISTNQNAALIVALVAIGISTSIICVVVLKKKSKEE